MVQPVAKIRQYEPSDEKLVLFTVGKANLELLAAANSRAYTHPITVAVWVALASAFVQIMGWWPDAQQGWMTYLRALPAFASTALPIMFFIDWMNRPEFEEHVQSILRRPDIRNVAHHYIKHKASGFWLLEYGDKFVGLLGLDEGVIRHFYVEPVYRPSGVQQDLLDHAVKHAFANGATSVEAFECPLVPYHRQCLESAGFVPSGREKTLGLLRWAVDRHTLIR